MTRPTTARRPRPTRCRRLSTRSRRPSAAPVSVLFAGLTPGLVGLGQANIQLVDPLPPGASLTLVIEIVNDAGEALYSSKPVQIAVAP